MYNICADYFDWLKNMVGERGFSSHSKLFDILHETDFRYTIPMDDSRYHDGVNLRYRFGAERNIPQAVISVELDSKPCSVLEMMVALALRCEEQIMCNSQYGDRTGIWFWHMITNMGLYGMVDRNFNRKRVNDILQRVLDRRYGIHGEGGWFYLPDVKTDMRNVEIWAQAMWYLNDVLKGA